MLSESRLSQESILAEIGEWSSSEFLAQHLTDAGEGEWRGGYFNVHPIELATQKSAWAAELFPHGSGANKLHHMVVVDHIDNESVHVRDPWKGNSYKITLKEFEHYWSGIGAIRK